MDPFDRDSESLAPEELKVLSDVREYGFHILMVGDLPEHEGHGDSNDWLSSYTWAFTIGLFRTRQHPEVIVFGLELESLGGILSDIGEAVMGGTRFEAGTVYDEILEGRPITFGPVHAAWYGPFLGYGRWFYRSDDFPVLHSIWPDAEGRWPWDDDVAPSIRGLQPDLSVPPSD